MSTSNTLRCSRARKAERLMDVMVFPHPPFWFTTAIVLMHAPPGSVSSLVGSTATAQLDSSKSASRMATIPWGVYRYVTLHMGPDPAPAGGVPVKNSIRPAVTEFGRRGMLAARVGPEPSSPH